METLTQITVSHLRSRLVTKMTMAERGGFEPPIRFNPYNGLANRRLQPLGHLSPTENVLRKIPRARQAHSQESHNGQDLYCQATAGHRGRLGAGSATKTAARWRCGCAATCATSTAR